MAEPEIRSLAAPGRSAGVRGRRLAGSVLRYAVLLSVTAVIVVPIVMIVVVVTRQP